MVGAVSVLLALSIVPWVHATSDTRSWYGYSDVMSYPHPGGTFDTVGWVVGVVVAAAVAAIVVVLLATLTREVSSAPRICAVVGLALLTALGFAAAHSFTSEDEDLHTSAGPWLFTLGAAVMAVVLLRPGIGGASPEKGTGLEREGGPRRT